MIDTERFAQALILAERSQGSSGIGTLSEKPLHKILKFYVDPNESSHEVKLLGSVVDVFNGDGVFEIQTGSFSPIAKKLKKLLSEHKVTLIHPIVADKTLIYVDKVSGELSEPKKSPKKGRYTDVLAEMFYLSQVFPTEGLTVKLLLVSADEYKYLDGFGESKTKGATKICKLLRRLIGEYELKSREDVISLLPPLPERFTAKEFSKALSLRKRKSYYALKFLEEQGIAVKVGKSKAAFLYELVKPSDLL